MPVSPLWLLSLWFWLASLSSGALWSYGSAFVVLVGVVGETITELTDWIKPEDLRKRVAKISAIVLILGLTGDLLGIRETQIEVASLTKEAGDAKKSAEGAASAAASAKTSADNANTVAGKALDKSKEATDAAGKALNASKAATDAAGKAQEQVGVVAKRADEINTGLTNLAICNAPRVISNWFMASGGIGKSYVDPLRPMAGQMVFIKVVSDAEARRAALNIARTLGDAQWNVQKPLQSVDGLADGVSVQPSVPKLTGLPKGEIPNVAPHWHASDVAEKLLDFLHSYNWQAVRGWPTDPQGRIIHDETILPAGAIRIQVGLYPPVVYVNPPGQKELTSRMEEIRREKEKADAERKCKREEQLATLPPELRKRLQQAAEEWEAKIKSETSKNPCQVLNPLF